MKLHLRTILFAITFLLIASPIYSQGITPPQEGKAVIYFARVTSLGFAIPFDFFHEKKYIGQFAGKNYLRYECDPGQHLFWASSENKEFITTDLKAGGIYIVIVDVTMGIGMARVGFTPISATHEVFERAKKLIDKKPSKDESPARIQSENIRLAGFIEEKLQQYEADWKQTKNFKHLSADMAIEGVQ